MVNLLAQYLSSTTPDERESLMLTIMGWRVSSAKYDRIFLSGCYCYCFIGGSYGARLGAL